jgi:von Willebrand factor type A domain
MRRGNRLGIACAWLCAAGLGSACSSNKSTPGDGGVAIVKPPPITQPTPNDAGLDNPAPLLDSGIARGGAGSSSNTCQSANVSATRVIPTIILVIDQSGSMNDSFGSTGGSRWTVLRDFLLKSDGLIASFETQVRFGLSMYSAVQNPDNSGTMTCPIVSGVAPALANFAAISDAWKKAQPLAETPTGDAIEKIIAGVPEPAPDKDNEPVVLILATDGEPDTCKQLNPQNGQPEAIAAVQHAFQRGIRTFIMSVGDEVSKGHQQDVANAGVGHKAGDPDAPYWTAGDDASLRSALTELVAAQVSCDVALQGSVAGGDPCEGTVQLNGSSLACNGADGWMLTDPKHIRLVGKACEDFKTQKSALVHASFPCTVDVIF